MKQAIVIHTSSSWTSNRIEWYRQLQGNANYSTVQITENITFQYATESRIREIEFRFYRDIW